MEKKPSNVIYGVNEKPPALVTFLLALQHIFLMSSTLLIPVVIVQEIGGSFLQIRSMVSFSMIAVGVGTILQSIRKGPVGSGYLVPNVCGPSYLSVSLQAAWVGGLPLMHGMIMIAGFFEAILSRVINKIKFLFPTEVTGLVVLMVGVTLIPLGASKFIGITYVGDMPSLKHIIVATSTLMVMIFFNLAANKKLRLYCVLFGMIFGYVLSYLTGMLTTAAFHSVLYSPFFALPGKQVQHFHWAFKWSLVLPFIIVSLCATLKSFGNLTTAQKINTTEWKKPDVKNIGNGLLADAMGVITSGFLGGVAVDTSTSNVGASLATGATSRYIGFVAGAIYILLGFSPMLASVVSIMPDAVMGAILLFVTSFMILSGFQIILSSKINTKKIFIVGLSFILGISFEIMPNLYVGVPVWLKPIFSSSLTLATVAAITLHQVLSLVTYLGKKLGK